MRSCKLAVAFLALGAGLAFAPAVDGVTNFHKINDKVYRGAQPTGVGYQSLARMGVRTVLDLRDERDLIRIEKKAVEAAGMKFVSIPMRGLSAPTEKQITKALEVLTDGDAAPVFVHCKRGADRTGTVIACYRISLEHWENQKALVEARTFGMSWVERGMRNFVVAFKRAVTAPAADAATPAPAGAR